MRLSLAGIAQIESDERGPVPLTPTDAVVLAWLAIEGPTSRARMAALLWPDGSQAQARAALRQRLMRLKKTTGFDLVGTAATLQLAAHVAHDLASSEDLLGDLRLPGAPELDAWLQAQRDQRRARTRDELQEQAKRLEDVGQFDVALQVAQALLRLEPLSELGHQRVIRLHYMRGDRAAALAAFDHCEKVLKDEVGATPSRETLALLATVESANGSALPAMRQVMPSSILRPPRLVGRKVELDAALHAWLSDRVFCIEGEAGMGKSRLLREIAEHGAGVVYVQARSGDAVVPYSTMARLLRAVVARSPRTVDAATQRQLAPILPEFAPAARALVHEDAGRGNALRDAVEAFFATQPADGVQALIVDDLHFADDATLEMLLHLACSGVSPAPRWGFARRPAEGSARVVELVDALLEEHRLDPVSLRPLTHEQLAELLGSLGLPLPPAPELADALHRHTGGNPMFALETLRQAWLDTGLAGGPLPRPASVTRLVERRLMRLSPDAIRLARCAAVAGADFTIGLAVAVLAVPAIVLAEAWSELEHAHVFVDGGFAHDLIMEAAHAGLPPVIARHLHSEIARHLEQHGAAPASIAAHWLAAEQPACAMPLLHRAGELALLQRRFAEAASAFEREARIRLDLADSPGAFAAASAMRQACFELDLAGPTDIALELLDRAASTPLQRASASAERAIVSVHRGAMAEAEVAITAGLAHLGSLEQPRLRSSLLQHLAAVRVWQQRPAEAFELLRAIEPDVASGGDAGAQIEFAQAYAVVLDHLDRPSEAVIWHRRGADRALAAGDLPRAAQILLNLCLGWRDCGRLDHALDALHEAQALLASLPEGAIPYSSLDLNMGIVLRDLGRYREALAWLDLAIARGRVHVPGWAPLFLAHRAQLWLALGQQARAHQDLEPVAGETAPAHALLRRELVRAQLERSLGRTGAAALERAASQLGGGGRVLSRHRLLLERCNVLSPADALAAAGEVLDAAVASRLDGVARVARTRLCQAALKLGLLAEAARHADALVDMPPGTGADDMIRSEAWLAAYRALAGVDERRAEVVLVTAVTWLRETARDHVPEEFRDSFFHRHPVHRELLALAARHGVGNPAIGRGVMALPGHASSGKPGPEAS